MCSKPWPYIASTLYPLTFPGHISEAPYYIEYLVEEKRDLIASSPHLLQSILFTSVKTFFKFPASFQHILAAVFDLCRKSKEPELTDRLPVYEELLKNGKLKEKLVAAEANAY